MEVKPKKANKSTKFSPIISILFLLHVPATLVAILREMQYKGWTCLDITKVCEPRHRSKILSFNNA
jgi:hypothetical protein